MSETKKRVGPVLVFAFTAFAVLVLFAVATANGWLSFVTGDVYKVTVASTPSTNAPPSAPPGSTVDPSKVGFAAGYAEGMKAAKPRGLERGRLLGYKHGFALGEHQGFKATEKSGYKAGYPVGMRAGHRAGVRALAQQLADWKSPNSQKKGASGG